MLNDKMLNHYKNFFDLAHDLLCIINCDGYFNYVNPAWEKVTGFATEEILAKPYIEVIHPEDRQQLLADNRKAINGINIGSFECRIACKDGSYKWFAWTGTASVKEKLIYVNGRDITERKAAFEALQRQSQREQLIRASLTNIHQSLKLEQILNTAVAEVRQFLQTDRVLIYRFEPDWSGVVVVEAVNADKMSILGRKLLDPHFATTYITRYQNGRIQATNDIYNSGLSECHIDLLAQFQVRANLVVPMLQGNSLWGLLIAQHCSGPRQWQQLDIDLLGQLATQMAIAIRQSELYQQVQLLNTDLEHQVQERTAQLQACLDFEAMLKRIADKVRDCIDESQILQTCVRELTEVLGAGCCDAALYDLEKNTSSICYEYSNSIAGCKGYVIQMDNRPDIYQQVKQGQYFQFCNITPSPIRGRVAMFVCPMMNGGESIGDLWLINPSERALNELEIRLVQQVANQCAIAIRQARLYQAAFTHVAELKKLNQLKDDFLWTVSHELRAPISMIKMALQVLEVTMASPGRLQKKHKAITKYLPILQTECDQELKLVDDLLLLQKIEAGVQPMVRSPIDLNTWLPQIVESFQKFARLKEQELHLNFTATLPILETNIFCLEKLLNELLTNACKFTPPRQDITVTASLVLSKIQIGVTNTGVEIPLSELPQIFDKFYRLQNADTWKQVGTGLGLSLVKRLVERLGGSIYVESQKGQTNFTVELPINIFTANAEL